MIPAQLKLIPGGLKRAQLAGAPLPPRSWSGALLHLPWTNGCSAASEKLLNLFSVHHFDGTKSAISRPIPDTKTPPNLAEGALKAREGNGPQLRMGLGLEIGDDWSVRGWQYILFTIQLLDILEVEQRK